MSLKSALTLALVASAVQSRPAGPDDTVLAVVEVSAQVCKISGVTYVIALFSR
jgi:hypothetical protein